MFVQDIKYYSDEESLIPKEDDCADVCVSDGNMKLLAFMHPAGNLQIGQELSVLFSLDYDDLQQINNDEEEYYIRPNCYYYGYDVIGTVVSNDSGLIKVFNFLIKLGRIPDDIQTGDWIKVSITRLDVYAQSIVKK